MFWKFNFGDGYGFVAFRWRNLECYKIIRHNRDIRFKDKHIEFYNAIFRHIIDSINFVDFI